MHGAAGTGRDGPDLDTPGRRLGRSDYAVGPVALARALLGCVLVRRLDWGERVSGVIVETEAYCGVEDKAAHSKGWRRTERTEPMFGPPGTSYVFLTYGMHHCFNAVCGAVDEPVAVLVRALEPAEGLGVMRVSRARPAGNAGRVRTPGEIADRDLCSGPAKLCQALGLDRSLNAVDLVEDERVWIEGRSAAWDERISASGVVNCPRVGIDSAGDWVDKPLRWYVRGNRHVSRVDRGAEGSAEGAK